jgi:CheY-like chemotaxis protein
MHDGTISVSSDGVGHGSKFTIILPAVNASEYSIPSQQAGESGIWSRISSHLRSSVHNSISSISSSSRSVTSYKVTARKRSVTNHEFRDRVSVVAIDENENDSHYKSVSVLLVDDAVLSRKMMRMSLGNKFDEILEAEDGVQAVDVIRRLLATDNPPEVILMDFMMPNMDGPTATAEIRRLGYAGLIIGVTGNTLPHDVRTFLSSGANNVLAKPLEVKVLDKALKGELSIFWLSCVMILILNYN